MKPARGVVGRPLAVPALAVAAGLCFAITLLTAPGGPAVVRVVDNLGQLAAACTAALACGTVAAAASCPRDRRGWGLLGAGCGAWALGQAVWSAYELLGGRDAPFPSLADAGYLGFPLLAGAALLGWLHDGRAGWLRDLLDGAVIACALLVLAWQWTLAAVVAAGAPSAWELALSLAYPVGDIVLVTLVMLCAARGTLGAPTTLLLLGAGVVGEAVSDSCYVVVTATGSYGSGDVLSVGWVTGFLLIAAAAHAARAESGSPSRSARPPDVRRRTAARRLQLALPYLPVGIAMLYASGQLLRGRPVPAVLVALGIAIIVLVLTRQFLVLADNGALVAELRRQEAQLVREASYDALTGLANRALFHRRVAGAVAADGVAVLLVDLDGFKAVNDSHGHPVGDALLVECAARLTDALRPSDTVARLGGDEFAVLLGDSPGGAHAAATAAGARVVEALRVPLVVAGRTLTVGASVGVSLGAPGADVDDVLGEADLAMYAAKAAGKGRVEVYRDALRATARRRFQLEEQLRHALEHDEVQVHYQPVVDLQTDRVTGMEALARWVSPTHGSIPPGEFVPLAEDSGLVRALGERVLADACRRAAGWLADGADLRVGVNLSARQLATDDVLAVVASALRASGLPAERLVLEVTESAFVDDAAVGRLRALRAHGVRIAVDDFGTGYSSLAYLGRLPLDIVKIDRAFVRAMTTDPSGRALVEAVLLLCDRLGYDAVAEGIETEADRVGLRALGCRYGQGYLFARPAPPDAVDRLIAAPLAVR